MLLRKGFWETEARVRNDRPFLEQSELNSGTYVEGKIFENSVLEQPNQT